MSVSLSAIGGLMLAHVFLVVLAQDLNDIPLAIRISCGSSQSTLAPKTSHRWLKDSGFTGGSSSNTLMQNMIAPQLNTLRYFGLSDGPENCYNISVPNGHYLLRFFLSYGDADNSNLEPQFDVSLEGTLVYSLKPGWSTDIGLAYADSLVFVDDGSATACFHSSGHGNPSVGSIEILQIPDHAYQLGDHIDRYIILKKIMRVSCGSNVTGFGLDFNANLWGGDRYWRSDIGLDKSFTETLGTKNSIKSSSAFPNFYPESIYQSTASTSIGEELSYTFQVEPNGNYSIWLHFAEISEDVVAEEQRVFDVLVNDRKIFGDIDIIGLSGDRFTALVLNKTVLVEGRTLQLTLRPVKGSIAINAFEIYQIIRTEYATNNEDVWALQALRHSLGLPSRLGWNGDPCVPQEHPWSGVNCGYDFQSGGWIIDGLDLDNQGLKGYISDDVARLQKLRVVNLSQNNLHGTIPPQLGNLTSLTILDLSYNSLTGQIPASLGKLSQLRKLFLNGNQLSGEVPTLLLSGPIHGASFNFSGNEGLCGIPGFPSCGIVLTAGAKTGIAIGAFIFLICALTCGVCMWKRRRNITRAQLLAAHGAPYAKSRTSLARDLQLSKLKGQDYFASSFSESVPQLL